MENLAIAKYLVEKFKKKYKITKKKDKKVREILEKKFTYTFLNKNSDLCKRRMSHVT